MIKELKFLWVEKMENLNREIETVQKNQIETLELKSKTSEIFNKNCFFNG